jgi:hypothetical protein
LNDKIDDMEKIHFKLDQDEDGYPPSSIESLWGRPDGENTFVIDNVPFFVRDIALGDRVETKIIEGKLWFNRKLSSGGHATLRLSFLQKSQIESVRQKLQTIGCHSELSHLSTLVSLDVPSSVDYDQVVWELLDLKDLGICEIEEACLPITGKGRESIVNSD